MKRVPGNRNGIGFFTNESHHPLFTDVIPVGNDSFKAFSAAFALFFSLLYMPQNLIKKEINLWPVKMCVYLYIIK